ncbi:MULTISPECIES: TAT-variant-translocated molybdopterin oxidoreductase [Mesonia]|mgnify:CR=1 FL=1|uniref:Menaquinone reductase, iron-sulfur cluster-binding subunit n=2 Tax=Flavobacteriaceae TaxID=49546 RepID=A0AC61Y8C3_9FLAO|nr:MULTISPECIES: TAT-variant-translocated molybdopterin oxidoreductase [Mesonia]MAN27435.1 quinol:cytochrome C oxidoreductase [Mesonia sp.]MAQ40290.1 quinol:cytochrome C oxidoreductase [Mesonia sp.]MBJ97201.1 quinol:cytochrome C oxidoreductase [Flavobacteriaceae bacterium]VVV00722.1 Menaquinone reductase, iron-sulfur cluster-binding subunit [Mesonia oceanica]|tara:strand:+ start:5533 stop:8619 length:3087 start_codon:yes stop_codon:yes gene_type:complete
MSSNKKYWRGVEELNETSPVVEKLRQNEFVEEIPTDEFLGDKESLESSATSRRDFLKFVGFSTAAASLAACEGPVTKTIPYVVQPDRIVPGVANYYATTMADGFDFASVLVKTREGRPIKIESNKMAKASLGANARVHASVLSLYDNQRIKRPQIDGEDVSWEEFDRQVGNALQNVGGQKVLLTSTMASPSTSNLIKEFSAKYGNVKHVVYDAVSEDAALDAYQMKYGERALGNYDFEKAEVIVSIGADFLGDWQAGGNDVGYSKSRIPKNGKMSRHIQFESNMTQTGAKADKRVPLKPSQQKAVLAAIYGYVVGGGSKNKLSPALDDVVVKAARQLRSAGAGAVVVSGIPDVDAQSLVLAINEALGSRVMDRNNPKLIRKGNAKQVAQLVKDMNSGSVGALLTVGVNPAFSLPNAEAFKEGMKKVEVSVAFSMKKDETAKLSKYIAATPHYLESWGDVQLTKKNFSLMQPTIRPLFDTRQFQDTLLKWTGSEMNYRDYIKETWASNLSGRGWNQALHDGVFEANSPVSSIATEEGDVAGMGTMSAPNYSSAVNNLSSDEGSEFELSLYTKVSLGDGGQANNPWLQEFPDPITRVSWDNYLLISKPDADKLGVKNPTVSNGALNGSYVNLKVGDAVVKNVPVIIQPGQAKGAVGLALGYGRKEAIQKEMQVGVNAYPLYKDFSAFQNVTIEKADGMHEFACVQLQSTMAGRDDIVKETTLEIFNSKDKHYWNPVPEVDYDHNEISVREEKASLWKEFDREIGHHFNLSIDLNACTGCGACVIACHSENNVPVVGKEEVRKFRDMHWLRIDRYYSSADTFKQEQEDLENLGAFETYDKIENASYDNPEVAFQPVMCQHCNHAPCETVCPVAATSHGRQGQNHMAYNRCVGTRYCANNCPYKVRRFNWFLYSENEEFDYNMNNDLGRMVLNPDVTVRSRGVMEKCSMCIQITQKTILDAKREGREVGDDEFFTACSRACDQGAMTFGDINNKDSKIVELKEDDRMYHLLESTGTKPNVMYQTLVKNTGDL